MRRLLRARPAGWGLALAGRPRGVFSPRPSSLPVFSRPFSAERTVTVHGLPVTAATSHEASSFGDASPAEIYDVALDDYLGFRGGAATTLEAVLDRDASFVMGHVLYAALHLLSPAKRSHGSDRALRGLAAAVSAAASALASSSRRFASSTAPLRFAVAASAAARAASAAASRSS